MIHLPSVWPVGCHTNNVGKDSTFVAIQGQKYDGINFVPLALEKGAKTIIADHTAEIPSEIIQIIENYDARLLFVANARRSLALLSAKAWGNPADKLKIIAITGTKGKTTTSWLLYHILRQAGHTVALLSTIKNKINDQEFPTELTTQHPDYLHAFFFTCVNAGVQYVVMEVAAQAYSLHRIAGLEFDGVVFTNFAQAHGEFYNSVEEYYAAKVAIVKQGKPGVPMIINADDEKGLELLTTYSHATSCAIQKMFAQVSVRLMSAGAKGLHGVFNGMDGSWEFMCPTLIGNYNLFNILAASTMAWRLGINPNVITQSVSNFNGLPGRLERYELSNGAICFIDHAHNPLSFEAVLPLMRSLTNHLIVVSGAGGDRDKSMRPILGQLMTKYADYAIFTTDNPRTEDPAAIIEAMCIGVPPEKKVTIHCELDREKAIEIAYRLSKAGTIIMLLGKGPEEYQIYGTTKVPFSEKQILHTLSNI